MTRLRVAILGSTGSIGRQALDVAARYPERIEIVALAAHSSVTAAAEQAARDSASTRLALGRRRCGGRRGDSRARAPVGAGAEAIERIAGDGSADLVLNALVGAAGLRASIAALRSGARLALANKESLVVGGELRYRRSASTASSRWTASTRRSSSACVGEPADAVARIWLTASGGPFRGADARRGSHA